MAGESLAGNSALANLSTARVAFQGEPGAFSEAAAIGLLGESITTIPRSTFDSAFAAISEGAADVLLAPVENTLASNINSSAFREPLFPIFAPFHRIPSR